MAEGGELASHAIAGTCCFRGSGSTLVCFTFRRSGGEQCARCTNPRGFAAFSKRAGALPRLLSILVRAAGFEPAMGLSPRRVKSPVPSAARLDAQIWRPAAELNGIPVVTSDVLHRQSLRGEFSICCCLGVSSESVPTRGFAPLASAIPARRTSACASTAWPPRVELNDRIRASEAQRRNPPAWREVAPIWLSGQDLHLHPAHYGYAAPLLVLPDIEVVAGIGAPRSARTFVSRSSGGRLELSQLSRHWIELVLRAGIAPARPFEHNDLNVARLLFRHRRMMGLLGSSGTHGRTRTLIVRLEGALPAFPWRG
jgi:hypothetical protein